MIEKTDGSQRSEDDAVLGATAELQSLTVALREAADGPTTEVFLIPGFNPSDARISAVNTRVSVMFPLRCREFILPRSGKFGIAFLAARSPLSLITDAGSDFRSRMAFGVGLCSLALITEDEGWIESVLRRYDSRLYSWERWSVDQSRITDVCHSRFEDRNVSYVQLSHSGVRDDATIWLIHELQLNLNRFVGSAARYAPYVASELDALVSETQELIGEIARDETVHYLGAERRQATKNDLAAFQPQFLHQKRRLDANIDLLVQLNSALVYALSQAFNGAVPIRQRFGFISQHSLLGTGTAWRAIHRICAYAFGVFRALQFPEGLRRWLDTKSTSAPVIGPGINSADTSEVRLNTRIVYFSARRGFNESDASISCPSQVIQACDQPEWSLATATHEILHAHVRELIAAIFCDSIDEENVRPLNEGLADIVQEYGEQAAGRPIPDETPPLNRLRWGILEFSLEYRNTIRKAREKHEVGINEYDSDEVHVTVTLPVEAETTFRAFKKSFRLLEEIVVHVLDLQYFYRCDPEAFCRSLWNSWSVVPSVLDKLDWYILRSLLAITSTLEESDPYAQLEQAIGILRSALDTIIRNRKGCVIALEVVRRLDREDGSGFDKWLDLLYPVCLPIVRLTRQYFVSSGLRQRFADGSNESTDVVRFESEDVGIRGVESAVGLVFNNLLEALSEEAMRAPSHETTARRSAALLLALSSEIEPSDTK